MDNAVVKCFLCNRSPGPSQDVFSSIHDEEESIFKYFSKIGVEVPLETSDRQLLICAICKLNVNNHKVFYHKLQLNIGRFIEGTVPGDRKLQSSISPPSVLDDAKPVGRQLRGSITPSASRLKTRGSGAGRVKCVFCNKDSKTKKELKEHLRSHPELSREVKDLVLAQVFREVSVVLKRCVVPGGSERGRKPA